MPKRWRRSIQPPASLTPSHRTKVLACAKPAFQVTACCTAPARICICSISPPAQTPRFHSHSPAISTAAAKPGSIRHWNIWMASRWPPMALLWRSPHAAAASWRAPENCAASTSARKMAYGFPMQRSIPGPRRCTPFPMPAARKKSGVFLPMAAARAGNSPSMARPSAAGCIFRPTAGNSHTRTCAGGCGCSMFPRTKTA